ncbi:MAG TPA: hypothetical protein VII12_00705 [Thermoanaerobaculia bacterium]
MQFRLLALLILTALLTTPLTAFERGEVYFETRTHFADRGQDVTGFDLWIYRSGWNYAASGGGHLLIYKYVPFAGPGQFFLVPAPNHILFQHDRTVSVWDGVEHYFEEPGKGYDDIFTDDTDLSEIAPGRAGRYLVAERWNDRARGAKLIEFDLHGRVAEYRFPEIISEGRALGALHIELLADHCTVLYTLGNDDPTGNRVHRLNICTNEPQTDFASLVAGEYAGAIRQLPVGDILVANGSAILRFTPEGSLVRGYQFPGVTHLALSVDGRTFWAGAVNLDKAVLREFDLDGNSRSIPLGNPAMTSAYVPLDVSDLVIVGEWRAGVDRRVRSVRRR